MTGTRCRRADTIDEAANRGGLDCIHFDHARSVAGNALAAAGSAPADPTWATTTVAGSSPACRQSDDRRRVLEPMDARGSALQGLRVALQGHHAKHERRCRQNRCEFSHHTLLVARFPN